MSETAAIPDGYTLAGYIAEVPGVSPALSFTYRPTPPLTAARFRVKRRAVADKPSLMPEDREVALELVDVEMAVGQTRDWDLTDLYTREPVPGPPTIDAVVNHFTAYQYRRFLDIVNHGAPSDERPGEPESGSTQPESGGNLEAARKN